MKALPVTGITMVTDMKTDSPMRDTSRLGLTALMLTVAVVLLGGIATTTAKAQAPEQVQLMCPVMTDEEVNPDISSEYKGRAVYFCCQKCRVKFEASPESYASAIVTTSATADSNAQGHDHSGHGHTPGSKQGSTLDGVMSAAGRFHPMMVHFPIALLVSAALARCLMLMGWVKWAGPAVRFCVLIGGISAVVAACLGWLNAGWPGSGESFGEVIFNHRWLGVATAVWGVVLIVMVEMEAGKSSKEISNLTTLGLFLGAGLVGAAGHFGGIMVFGPDYLPW